MSCWRGCLFGVVGFGLRFRELDGVTGSAHWFKETFFHASIITIKVSWNYVVANISSDFSCVVYFISRVKVLMDWPSAQGSKQAVSFEGNVATCLASTENSPSFVERPRPWGLLQVTKFISVDAAVGSPMKGAARMLQAKLLRISTPLMNLGLVLRRRRLTSAYWTGGMSKTVRNTLCHMSSGSNYCAAVLNMGA